MNNSDKFFANKECRHYPCHACETELNCLFCFCPLYGMENCPGNSKYIEKNGRRIKSCIECAFPHIPQNYDKVMQVLKNQNSIAGDRG